MSEQDMLSWDALETAIAADADAAIREELAAALHAGWTRWMLHLFSNCKCNESGDYVIPAGYVKGLQRQMGLAYAELTEMEQQLDCEEADGLLPIVYRWLLAAMQVGEHLETEGMRLKDAVGLRPPRVKVPGHVTLHFAEGLRAMRNSDEPGRLARP